MLAGRGGFDSDIGDARPYSGSAGKNLDALEKVRVLSGPGDSQVQFSQTQWVASFRNTITAVLTVRRAADAVAFYERALGAEEIYRNTYPNGKIVADMAIGQARFRVADETPEAGILSPQSLAGTCVRLNLMVADPDAVAARAIAQGAVEIAPVADQSYGLRQGRLADPYGHQWLIGRPLAGPAGDWAIVK